MTIIVNLDKVLMKNKTKARQLAHDTKIKEQTISLIKNGKTKGININVLEKICSRLNCSPEEILFYVDEKNIK